LQLTEYVIEEDLPQVLIHVLSRLLKEPFKLISGQNAKTRQGPDARSALPCFSVELKSDAPFSFWPGLNHPQKPYPFWGKFES
jgi:hypothetical protein